MEGWFKIHRSIFSHKYFSNPQDFAFWIWLIGKASIEDRITRVKAGANTYYGIKLKRGQMIFGRNQAEKETGISVAVIRRALEMFENDGNIKIESSNRFSVITICNYNDYQDNANADDFEIIEEDQQTASNQPSVNQRATSEQPASNQQTASNQPHNKKVKKVKESRELKESKRNKNTDAEALPSAAKNTYKLFMEIYSDWYKELNQGVPPKIDGAGGNAAKSLIVYFRQISTAKAKKDGQLLDEQATEAVLLDSWRYLLGHWIKLDGFMQGKTRLIDINSNIANIITQIKNGHGTKKSKPNTGGAVTDEELISGIAAFARAEENRTNGHGG